MLGTVLVAEIMDLVDATIVNIAAPSIRAELGGSESALQWMLAGYTLAFAIGLVTFGRLGDLVGRRRLFVIGAVGFTIASALCGLATSPGTADRQPGGARTARRGDDPAGLRRS